MTSFTHEAQRTSCAGIAGAGVHGGLVRDHHPSRTGVGLWLRYTIIAPRSGEPYCELWSLYFDPDNKKTFAGVALLRAQR
ncbi:MAG: hypothetical protein M3343_08750 [Actinomycetota bacterium]|nr:hypothetical protein [Actinomycetota bacterium]